MFLTDEELYQLTGYKQAGKQCVVLRKQGVAFFTNAAGHPRVVRAVLEGGKQPNPAQSMKQWRPTWADTPA